MYKSSRRTVYVQRASLSRLYSNPVYQANLVANLQLSTKLVPNITQKKAKQGPHLYAYRNNLRRTYLYTYVTGRTDVYLYRPLRYRRIRSEECSVV